jgi:hypothetical protein
MRIIFLDIDGVLNSSKFIKRLGKSWTGAQIDPEAVSILNEIIRETEAKIVISSSWRIVFSLERINSILNDNGFVGEIIGETPRVDWEPYSRGNEIQMWLDSNPDIESFVIIDDYSDMGELIKFLVQTKTDDGLLKKHIPLIIKLLTNN